ncbi:hypothetical protein [Paenibacillus sp. ISL-20]|uniref:hypothetical protein n=1 Tax=Paenibacillus sp. ISL-20 TaxID=2819163 RepID=UPI001BEB51ED|nr:hypothetical protein [Paenibacillus sp. ISL-20]MBT2764048.1 hypothetical protein [Paenibacillus sp. ISL-20]
MKMLVKAKKLMEGEAMKKILLISICIFMGIIGLFLFIEKDSSNTAIEAKEKSRGFQIDDIVLQKDILNGQLVFFLRNINDGQQVVSAEYVKKTLLGWKWVFGGGHSLPNYQGENQKMIIDESWSTQYLPSTRNTEFGKSTFPILFGVIKNSEINSVIVRDLKNSKELKAEIVKTNSSLRFWYVFVKEDQGKKFTISAMSKDETEVSVKTIDEEQYSQIESRPYKTKLISIRIQRGQHHHLTPCSHCGRLRRPWSASGISRGRIQQTHLYRLSAVAPGLRP